MSSKSRQKLVVEAIRQWQTRLLQLDRRNGLLYFSIGKRGVAIRDGDPDALLARLAGARRGLSFLYAERVRVGSGKLVHDRPAPDEQEFEVRVRPGDLKTDLQPMELQKRLTAIARRTREWQEEQGLNVLFVAAGFLHWIDDDQQPACSPLLLIPCELSRESPRDPFVLSAEELDERILNPTLRHKLAAAFRLELPELEESTVGDYLKVVGRLVSRREGWSVDQTVVVATFPFSKLAMWEDLNLMAATGTGHPLVCRLAGDIEAEVHEPAGAAASIPRDDEQLSGGGLDDLLEIRDQYTVVDADFSQLRAIELARSGANLVIHGPPGTGKSQTIANLVATLLAEGRCVLFVSEKTAALDVVKRRLSEVGLGSFCLDLHSSRGKKASVYAQLRSQLAKTSVASSKYPYERLVARRNALNATVRALHLVREPLGLSVFAVHGRLAALGEVPRADVPLLNGSHLTKERLRRIEDAASRIARRRAEFSDHHTSRWRALGDVAPSPGLADSLRHNLSKIRSTLEELMPLLANAALLCSARAPRTLAETSDLLRLLGHLEAIPGPIPAQWLADDGLDRAEEQSNSLRLEAAERRRLLDVLSGSIIQMPVVPWEREWLETAVTLASTAETRRGVCLLGKIGVLT